MPRKKLELPLIPVEFPCFNCEGKITVTKHPKLFCSGKCQQEAKFIRYYRSCKNDGRINQSDVREALQIRIAHILSGGYKERARHLPLSVRLAVYKRDNRICKKCGQPGNDIDHINGDGNDLENLQVLCRNCHNEKTKLSFKEITPEIEGYTEKKVKVENLRSRTESAKPQKVCDDEKNWNANQKTISAKLRKILYNERFLAYGRNEGIDVSEFEAKVLRAKDFSIEKVTG